MVSLQNLLPTRNLVSQATTDAGKKRPGDSLGSLLSVRAHSSHGPILSGFGGGDRPGFEALPHPSL